MDKPPLEELSPLRFRYDNSGRFLQEAQPWFYPINKTPFIGLNPGWKVIGWCHAIDLGVLCRKDDDTQLAIMFATPDNEECWFHAHKNFLELLDKEILCWPKQ